MQCDQMRDVQYTQAYGHPASITLVGHLMIAHCAPEIRQASQRTMTEIGVASLDLAVADLVDLIERAGTLTSSFMMT